MDLEGLRAFIAVADTGSFSLAAERLYLTQPAISKRISQLEQQLDGKLFDRIGRQIELTEAGSLLNDRARVILGQVEDTERAIQNLSGDASGQLSLATSHHVGLWRLPSILKTYMAHHPGVTLDLHFMDSEIAQERVLQGELEIAICTLRPGTTTAPLEKLEVQPIWRDPLLFVASPAHPLCHLTQASLTQLADFPAILPDLSTFTGRIVQQLFEEADLPLDVSMSTNYLETIKMLIGVGLGWSVLPASMVDDEVQILDVDFPVERQLGVVRHVDRTLSNAASAFIEILENESDYD